MLTVLWTVEVLKKHGYLGPKRRGYLPLWYSNPEKNWNDVEDCGNFFCERLNVSIIFFFDIKGKRNDITAKWWGLFWSRQMFCDKQMKEFSAYDTHFIRRRIFDNFVIKSTTMSKVRTCSEGKVSLTSHVWPILFTKNGTKLTKSRIFFQASLLYLRITNEYKNQALSSLSSMTQWCHANEIAKLFNIWISRRNRNCFWKYFCPDEIVAPQKT